MSTQRPSASNVQPWYGHCRRPSVTVAAASGTSRCGQRAGNALTSPPGRSRTTTNARPPAPTGTGVVPTSAARATGNQPAVLGFEAAMRHCSARGFPAALRLVGGFGNGFRPPADAQLASRSYA